MVYIRGKQLVDLDYLEDSSAEVDANFVLSGDGNLIEIQGTAEKEPVSIDQFNEMLKLAKNAASELFILQNKILLM